MSKRWLVWLALPVLSASVGAQEVTLPIPTEMKAPTGKPEKKPDFPKWSEASDGFKQVVSTADGKKSLYGIWTRSKDEQMLAELPSGFEKQKHFIALTRPSGETFAGLQSGDYYVYWKRFDKRVALIAPNVGTRSSGDKESQDSVGTIHTDRVLVDVPIVCMGPGGQPVIDMDAFLVSNASKLYGSSAAGMNKSLATIAKAKAFPNNVELAFEVPDARGVLKTFHYSISVVPENASYKPRKADERVGYFTTAFRDLGKFKRADVWDRRINRWHLEKADPNLKLSPPKEPITFYLEHTVPVRYRRYVKQGVLYWNKAFEEIGISDAMVVHYQDKSSGAHMDKDPEDVRYNFVRWLSNDIGTAIGPSRAHPITGQILDADIVLTDGWIRAFWYQANDYLPEIAMEGFSRETLSWLEEHPDWDPRIRLSAPEEREQLLAQRANRKLLGSLAYEIAQGDASVLGSEQLFDLASDLGPEASLCMASVAKAESMAFAGITLSALGLLDEVDGGEESEDGEKKEERETIDGIPEWFIGPSLAELVAHEVGHTLGLRHNFKASSIYTMEEMNTEEFRGTPLAGSVMDYLPLNAVIEDGKLKGDHAMIGIGPYDHWAIEYGYTFEDTDKVLERVAEPHLQYLSDEDTSGPDPLARRYDLYADPRDYSKNLIELVRLGRERLLENFVKEGESWSRARYGYEITLRNQTSAVSVMANWLGGAFVHRDRKGDPNGRAPIEIVPAEQQREALKFVIENSFFDESFDLTPELLERMTVDKWSDEGGRSGLFSDPTWPIHDRIAGVQASTLTMVMNPTTLRRVYDNELFQPNSTDVLTLPELLQTVTAAAWQEIDYVPESTYSRVREAASPKRAAAFTVRKPKISSLRRNLQREHLERLIDLCLEGGRTASSKSISLLARTTLHDLGSSIEEALAGGKLDPYSRAHLTDAQHRIEKVMEASYSYGGGSNGGGGSQIIIQLGK